MIDRTRGFCQECRGGPFKLKRDGTLWSHLGVVVVSLWPYRRARCKGSGRKPLALYGE